MEMASGEGTKAMPLLWFLLIPHLLEEGEVCRGKDRVKAREQAIPQNATP